MRSTIFFVEGVHDVNCVGRVLILLGFEEVNTIDELPEMWQVRIPKAYPFIDNRLDRHIPMPSFFINEKLCVAIVSSNGGTNIINDIDLYLSNMTKVELKKIDSICAIFDADKQSADDALNKVFKKHNKDVLINKKDFMSGYCRIRGEKIDLYIYFFPDNKSSGNLENFLLEGASIVYSDLLNNVDEYIKNIDEKYKYNWSISSANKVKVGCIANIFRPGSANQVSIRYDDWISEESINYSSVIKEFYEFVMEIIS